MQKFNFDQFFILDLANNHQGSLNHAQAVIEGHGEIVRKHGVRAGLKFQFRELDSFVHPDHKSGSTNKHVPRFLSTRLDNETFATLTEDVRRSGLTTIATPFDEPSVDLIERLGIEVIKIASCSAKDRPLLDRISQARLPVIASTAGLSLSEIDFLVTYLEDRNLHYAIMHCVALYPTSFDQLRMNQIDLLKRRFPNIHVGFSTHEDPNDLRPIQIAYAKGATLFERHVGSTANNNTLNGYSSTPEQLDAWLSSYNWAVTACGGQERSPHKEEEIQSLKSLARGVFARRDFKKGDTFTKEDVFFAMPQVDGCLTSANWRDDIVATRDYSANEALDHFQHDLSDKEIVNGILIQTRSMLNVAGIPIGKESAVEISHHYGLERFREFGAIIVTCVNRSYTKKLVIQLPRQKHPYHRHKIKEETFQLLYGDLEIELEGARTKLAVGDTVLVPPGTWHKFHTLDGCIFEEVSTTHLSDDSFYEDESIARLEKSERKTFIPNWEKTAATSA